MVGKHPEKSGSNPPQLNPGNVLPLSGAKRRRCWSPPGFQTDTP
jgi:hypothetical protein